MGVGGRPLWSRVLYGFGCWGPPALGVTERVEGVESAPMGIPAASRL